MRWLSALLAALVAGPLAAQETVPLDCAAPGFSEIVECSQARLKAYTQDARAWLSCKGACIVRSDDAGSTITPTAGGEATRLEGLQFLHGYQRTTCQRDAMVFYRANGALFLVAIDGASVGKPQPLDLPLAIPAEDSGFLSCDGRTLIYRTAADEALQAFDVASSAAAVPEARTAEHGIFGYSPDGRYLLAVERETGLIVAREVRSGQQVKTDAIFELDQVFFDVDVKHLIIVRRSQDPVLSQVFSLPQGSLLQTLPTALPGGLPIGVDDQKHPPAITIYEPE